MSRGGHGETKMANTKGLTSKQMTRFMELCVVANDDQLTSMATHILDTMDWRKAKAAKAKKVRA